MVERAVRQSYDTRLVTRIAELNVFLSSTYYRSILLNSWKKTNYVQIARQVVCLLELNVQVSPNAPR